MSRHIGRKETWCEVSRTRFNGHYGYVQMNTHGLWDAILVYQQRPALGRKGESKKGNQALIDSLRKMKLPEHLIPKPEEGRPWRRATKHCGEYKRSRNAMMAVEEAAKKLKAEKNPDKLL